MSQRDIDRLHERVRRIELVLVGVLVLNAPPALAALVRLFL